MRIVKRCFLTERSRFGSLIEIFIQAQRRFRERPYMLMVHPDTLGNERSIDSLIGLRRGSPSLEISWFHVIFSEFKSGIVLKFLGP